MKFYFLLFASFCTLNFPLLATDWLCFRGNLGNGMIQQDLMPKISTSSPNSWKTELPGRGLSSPVIVGNLIFLTASSEHDQSTLHVLAFNSKNGEKVWERKFKATGRTICHEKTCVAAPTMVSNGKLIIAQFSSNDVFCLDLQGNLKWLRGLTFDYPNAANGLGMSSSPLIIDDVVIAQVENDAESFTTGLSLTDGKTIWKKDRPKGANWTSPAILKNGKLKSVVLQSMKGISVINPKNGNELWNYQEGASTIPSSTVCGEIILVPSNGLTAVKGINQLNSHTQLWRDNKLGPGTGSPAISGSNIYVINKANVLSAADINTGEILWRMRIKGPISGSPITTDSHLFVFNEEGLGQIIKLEKEGGETVHTIDLAQTILCSPAVSDNSVFIRSDKNLWKLSAR